MNAPKAYAPKVEAERRIEGLNREEIIRAYTPKVRLISSMIAAKVGGQVDFDDLVQVGMVGLLEAIEKYDGARATKFSTFAEFRIRGAILDSLRNLDLLSRTAREKANRIKRALRELRLSLGREPSHPEMANALGVDLEGYFEMLDEVKAVTLHNLDDTGGDPEGRALSETLSSPDDQSAYDNLEDADTRAVLKDAIQKLPERSRQIILLYYFKGLNLKEIGRVLSLSESRVCQLHTDAIMRLRTRAQRQMEG